MASIWTTDCQVLGFTPATARMECDGFVELCVNVNAVIALTSRACVSAFPCARQPI
ncbi:MAG: hypothetical protein PHI98_14130 [Eubacteriales bacterium]|nr:hypothetical protein [Eubacteriales bacterium]